MIRKATLVLILFKCKAECRTYPDYRVAMLLTEILYLCVIELIAYLKVNIRNKNKHSLDNKYGKLK